MDLNTINDMWEKDSKIDEVMLDNSTLQIPRLHQKYLTLHSEYSLLLKQKELQLRQMKHEKWLYYSGKAAPEAYEDKPFHYKVLKGEVSSWVEVDEEISKVEMKLQYYGVVIRTLEEILKQIHQLSFNIKNIIEWRRFTGGV